MRISEIFYSLQGEGSMLGVPSVFVRTSGCNLRCSWCDTPYTSWTPEGGERSLDEIQSEIASYPATHVVITGGEPLIARDVVGLTLRCRAMGMHITIETAGTVFAPVECDLMSISPKLANSTPAGPWSSPHDEIRGNLNPLISLTEAYPYQLKFVVSTPNDLAEIQTVIDRVRAPRERVILMPEGVDAETLRERGGWISEICKREGYRFSPRLHIDLWGNRRGV